MGNGLALYFETAVWINDLTCQVLRPRLLNARIVLQVSTESPPIADSPILMILIALDEPEVLSNAPNEELSRTALGLDHLET